CARTAVGSLYWHKVISFFFFYLYKFTVQLKGRLVNSFGPRVTIQATYQRIYSMPYPEIMIQPMREDLTRLGVEELRTADAVDQTVQNSKGTLMVVVNSICGCAAGKARPGVALALQSDVKPDKVATVFAGA